MFAVRHNTNDQAHFLLPCRYIGYEGVGCAFKSFNMQLCHTCEVKFLVVDFSVKCLGTSRLIGTRSLIVVNCIILGRAEAYASKNPPIPSLFDGIGMGLGFTLSITCIGAVRELLGAGQLFGQQILPLAADGKMGYEPITIFILAPGAFFVLAMLAALQNKFKIGAAKRGIDPSEGCNCCSGCDSCSNTMCKGGKQA